MRNDSIHFLSQLIHFDHLEMDGSVKYFGSQWEVPSLWDGIEITFYLMF